MGAIFLTVFIDLVGFSIIFPLFPSMLQWYLPLEGGAGPLSAFVALVDRLAPQASGGPEGFLAMVFFGGVLGSLYSLLQFVASPIWGRISDRHGRRRVLLVTIGGTCASYLLWAFSGQFVLLLLSRFLGGIMAGNLSVATAAIADVTARESRSKGMALIGVAFGLGFIVGPVIGGMSSLLDLTGVWPGALHFGLNPFSVPALAAALLALVNLLWVYARVQETLPERRRDHRPIAASPFARLRSGGEGPVRRVLLVYFVFLLTFSGMEFTLTFLALERLSYGPRQNALLFVFVGIVLMVVQGWFVRRYARVFGERKLALVGVASGAAGMVLLGLAPAQGLFYTGLFFMGTGVALVSPSLTALVSLYTIDSQQGAALGAFRAAGSLSRAIGPFAAAAAYWALGSRNTYIAGGLLLLLPLVLALALPQPRIGEAPDVR